MGGDRPLPEPGIVGPALSVYREAIGPSQAGIVIAGHHRRHPQLTGVAAGLLGIAGKLARRVWRPGDGIWVNSVEDGQIGEDVSLGHPDRRVPWISRGADRAPGGHIIP